MQTDTVRRVGFYPAFLFEKNQIKQHTIMIRTDFTDEEIWDSEEYKSHKQVEENLQNGTTDPDDFVPDFDNEGAEWARYEALTKYQPLGM